MSDSDFALRLAPPSELREMVQTLTRELDEARRLHMGQAARAAGWRARARYAREALERLIELVADDPEAKDTTTPLCVAVTVARAEVTAIEEAERRDADRSTPPLELTVREAARQRVPLDGADAQALEGALALTERERDEARAEAEELRTRTAAQLEIETRARDEARAEVERLRALPSAEDLEERAHEILDGAGIPTHALDPVSGEEDYRADLEERLEWTVEEITRLRGALERAERRLTELADVDTFDAEVPWPENEKPEERARAGAEDARAALAGEGEAKRCAWTQDDEGVWHTGCGASWIYFPGGTPDEHGQRFCHACGKSIAAAAGLDDEGRPSP